ncbi:MAG: 2-dehydropantoate 2-reductase [Acidimicrobiia bacterium]|nr:2-dehydropantoate 2-reductase [Acidimicrobiia bacterium]
MRVVVYGAGAVGGFWAALLARAGHDVHVIARGAHLQALRDRGIRIASAPLGDLAVHPIQASSSAAGLAPADLVLLAVKTHQTAGVLDDLAQVVAGHTVVIALQNGIESDDLLVPRFGGHRVLGAVVYVGAVVHEAGVIGHAHGGMLILGNPHGVDAGRVEAVVACLNAPGLKARMSDSLERQRWHKLMWNTAFNPVSALTQQDSQALLRTPETRALLEAAMREVVAVAEACGVPLTGADVDKSLADTGRQVPIRTSMLEDRARGRETEHEALVGVVVRLGREAGVPTPVTATLYALLKAGG